MTTQINKYQVLKLEKNQKEYTFDEFEKLWRGTRFKTVDDFVQARYYLDMKLREMAWYWNVGIDGRNSHN